MEERQCRIFRSLTEEGVYLGKLTFFVVDRPGSLAELAGRFPKYGLNIITFHYNRSEHPNRVLVEVVGGSADDLEAACQEISGLRLCDPGLLCPGLELGLLDTRNILKLEVRLENRPGTLGEFARLLQSHKANVIYMSYDEDVSANSASFSLATDDPAEVDVLLRHMNAEGYQYSLIYKGASQKEVEDIIGLNLAERFFFKMKGLLDTEDIGRLKKLVSSSAKISETLVAFSREAGKDLDAGGVFTGVLTFASASLSRTGENFRYRRLPSIESGGVIFHAFRLPTGGNVYILEGPEESVMIDGGYGLYYDDLKKVLRKEGLEPSRISRIYVSHADSDHAGMCGHFAAEFGARLYLHRAARETVVRSNRAWGSNTPYMTLNHYFTVLVDEFTGSNYGKAWIEYGDGEMCKVEGFRVIDTFAIGGQEYQVLESLGGHVPGQVFFMSRDSGLIFTADYLLLIESLDPEEREILSLPKFMMISTNVDSPLFREEMKMLKRLVLAFDEDLRRSGRRAIVVPGHGDYYPAERLRGD